MERLRRLTNSLLLGLFSPNRTGFLTVAAILMVVETFLSYFVIQKVPYTEIDWSTYMQQVECYVNKGISNYSRIGGDTGPVVYPAGHIWVYRILHLLTNSGKNIRAAQYIFQVFYLLNLVFVFRIFYKAKRIPPIVLFLVTVTGYRIHSIFVLRLFNDPVAMLLFYVAMDLFLEEKWLAGCVFYSLAVSIKMNVLLFAPALFVTLVINTDFIHTLGYIMSCGLIQIYVGSPFLLYDWKSYVTRSFDLGRVFMFKWTVNWRFLPEEIFLDKRFHVSLLVGHLTFLAIFAWYMWFRRTNGLWASMYLSLFRSIPTKTPDTCVLYAFFTSNLIGITFSRSLHYQFYSWYFHQLPFLLFCYYPEVQNVSQIPWLQFFWKVPLLLAIELAWNVYPSTWWSSALLHICHVIILLFLIYRGVPRPEQSTSAEDLKRIQERKKEIDRNYKEHGTVLPPLDMEGPSDQELLDKRQEILENPQPLYKNEFIREAKFYKWFREEKKDIKEEYRAYLNKKGKRQYIGLTPKDENENVEFHERVKMLRARISALENEYHPNPNPNNFDDYLTRNLEYVKEYDQLLKEMREEEAELTEYLEKINKSKEENEKTTVRKRQNGVVSSE